MRRTLPATTVYLMFMAADGFLLHLTTVVFSVFLIVEIGLDPLRLVLMGTILEASFLLFEVPTGVVADTVSRRLSVIVGVAGSGLGFLLLGASTSFLMAGLSQVVWGVFATFVSGADVAWLTDEVGEERAREYYVRGDQLWNLASLAGIAASVALASIDLRLPIIVCGVGSIVLAGTLAVVMPEEHFRPRDRKEGERLHQGLVATFRAGLTQVRAHHVLLLIIAVAAVHGASTEGFDRLADFHILRDIGLPPLGGLNRVVWFGILDGVALVIGVIGLQVLRRRTHLVGHVHVARLLAAIDLVLIAGVVVFAVAGSFWLAVAAFWLVSALRNVRRPIFTAWINQGLDPATRATINSMASQADAVGQAGGGPVLGVIANRASVPWALAVSGLLRAPALLLYAVAIRRGTVGTAVPVNAELELHLDEP